MSFSAGVGVLILLCVNACLMWLEDNGLHDRWCPNIDYSIGCQSVLESLSSSWGLAVVAVVVEINVITLGKRLLYKPISFHTGS